MRRHTAKMFLATGAIASALGLGATSALASATATWTVTPGGGNVLTDTPEIVLTDDSTGTQIICKHRPFALDLMLFLKSGSGLSSFLGNVGGFHATLNDCSTPSGQPFAFTGISGLQWGIRAQTYDSSTGVTKGQIRKIDLTMSGPSCSFVIDGTGAGADNGTVVFEHSNSAPAKLVIRGGSLHLYNVSGCTGLFSNGDHVTLSAAFHLSKGQTITSP